MFIDEYSSARRRGGDGAWDPAKAAAQRAWCDASTSVREHTREVLSKLVCYSTQIEGVSGLRGDISTLSHWRFRSARAALCIALCKTSTAHAARKPITRRVRDDKHLPQTSSITPHNHDGRQVARPAASFHRSRSRAQENRRAHARAPTKPREWTSRRTAKRHRRDAGSPSSRRRAPRHRASASSPSPTPEVPRTSTPGPTNCKEGRTTS